MLSETSISNWVENHLEGSPLFLVDLSVSSGSKITIQLDGDNGVKIEDCVAVTRAFERAFDREEHDYMLDVSSAGVGRPLKKWRQYRANVGRTIKVKTIDDAEMEGELLNADDQRIVLKLPASKKKKLEEREVALTTDEIQEAKVKISFK